MCAGRRAGASGFLRPNPGRVPATLIGSGRWLTVAGRPVPHPDEYVPPPAEEARALLERADPSRPRFLELAREFDRTVARIHELAGAEERVPLGRDSLAA